MFGPLTSCMCAHVCPCAPSVLMHAQEMLAGDLFALFEEAKKLEGIGHAIAGLFGSSDAPDVKELCTEALQQLNALVKAQPTGPGSLEAIRQSTVRLHVTATRLLFFREFLSHALYSKPAMLHHPILHVTHSSPPCHSR